jgi:3-deoxy-D-manno-octulosonate 8-phosphate phosphatase (KDO 8-P phosphatase)
MKPKCFILDVDGVMTTGQFLYSKKGKEFKVFGPDDSDALKILKEFLPIYFISADKRGFSISKKRIEKDMGFTLELVSSKDRVKWISERWDLNSVIYMGDGFWDAFIFKQIKLGIAPQNAFYKAKEYAGYITKHNSGDRAVAEAALFILEKYFDKKFLQLR